MSAANGAANGGADYSAQWAEYYRSTGKHKEAEAIEAQMKQKVINIVRIVHFCLVWTLGIFPALILLHWLRTYNVSMYTYDLYESSLK